MASVELTSSWTDLALVAVSAVAMLAAMIVHVRVIGLRSFSKMSSFDFAITVAMGSLLAGIALSGSSLADGVVAVGALLGTQTAIAFGRSRFGLSRLVDNKAMLLMSGSTMLEGNMRLARVTADDLRAKLREANVRNYGEVRYVVFETTGDVSVVTGSGDLERDILDDVVDGHRVFE